MTVPTKNDTESEKLYRDLDQREAERISGILDKLGEKALDDSLEWERESMRHLVTLNAAGLAAAATIMAGSTNDLLRDSAVAGGKLCAGGLVIAFASLLFRAILAGRDSLEIARFHIRFLQNKVPIGAARALQLPAARLFHVATALSFALLVLAAGITFNSLNTTRKSLADAEEHATSYRFRLPDEAKQSANMDAVWWSRTSGASYRSAYESIKQAGA